MLPKSYTWLSRQIGISCVTYVVHSAPAAAPPDPGRPGTFSLGEVDLLPWVLVAPDHHARIVTVQHEQRLLRRLVSEKPSVKHTRVRPVRLWGDSPVFEGKVEVRVGRRGDIDGVVRTQRALRGKSARA